MRKIISIILLSSLLLLCLSGCSIFGNGDVNDGPMGKTDDRPMKKDSFECIGLSITQNNEIFKTKIDFSDKKDTVFYTPVHLDLSFKINLINNIRIELSKFVHNPFEGCFVYAHDIHYKFEAGD